MMLRIKFSRLTDDKFFDFKRAAYNSAPETQWYFLPASQVISKSQKSFQCEQSTERICFQIHKGISNEQYHGKLNSSIELNYWIQSQDFPILVELNAQTSHHLMSSKSPPIFLKSDSILNIPGAMNVKRFVLLAILTEPISSVHVQKFLSSYESLARKIFQQNINSKLQFLSIQFAYIDGYKYSSYIKRVFRIDIQDISNVEKNDQKDETINDQFKIVISLPDTSFYLIKTPDGIPLKANEESIMQAIKKLSIDDPAWQKAGHSTMGILYTAFNVNKKI